MVEILDEVFVKYNKGENIRNYKLNNVKTGQKQPPKFNSPSRRSKSPVLQK